MKNTEEIIRKYAEEATRNYNSAFVEGDIKTESYWSGAKDTAEAILSELVSKENVPDDLRKLVDDYIRAYGEPNSYSKYLAFASCIASWERQKNCKSVQTVRDAFDQLTTKFKDELIGEFDSATINRIADTNGKYYRRGLEDGARCQREHTQEDMIDGEVDVRSFFSTKLVVRGDVPDDAGFKAGDKVKLKIIKDEE